MPLKSSELALAVLPSAVPGKFTWLHREPSALLSSRSQQSLSDWVSPIIKTSVRVLYMYLSVYFPLQDRTVRDASGA